MSDICRQFSTSMTFEPPSFQNGANHLISKTNLLRNDDWSMFSLPKLVQFAPRTSEIRPPFGDP